MQDATNVMLKRRVPASDGPSPLPLFFFFFFNNKNVNKTTAKEKQEIKGVFDTFF
jgi:hypothetical protein